MIAARHKALATGISLPKAYLDYWPTIARHPFAFVLELGGTHVVLGSNPFRVLLAKGGRVTEWRAGRKHVHRRNPFDVLREALDEHAVRDNDTKLPFAGGAVGYLGYDLGRHLERLPER